MIRTENQACFDLLWQQRFWLKTLVELAEFDVQATSVEEADRKKEAHEQAVWKLEGMLGCDDPIELLRQQGKALYAFSYRVYELTSRSSEERKSGRQPSLERLYEIASELAALEPPEPKLFAPGGRLPS